MVYIFECLSGLEVKPDQIEEMRQKLKGQITDGCVLLPADMRLVKVVETDPEPMVITTTPPDNILKQCYTYPGVADDITEEAYDRRDGKR